jgi:hypothetical protein
MDRLPPSHPHSGGKNERLNETRVPVRLFGCEVIQNDSLQ